MNMECQNIWGLKFNHDLHKLYGYLASCLLYAACNNISTRSSISTPVHEDAYNERNKKGPESDVKLI